MSTYHTRRLDTITASANGSPPTLAEFTRRLKRLTSAESCQKLLADFEAVRPESQRGLAKARRAVERHLATCDQQRKAQAKRLVNADDRLKGNCTQVVVMCAGLSMFLNALAGYVGLEVYMRAAGASFGPFELIGREILQTGSFCRVSLLDITRWATIVYGVMIPLMVLRIFAVAAKSWHRYAVAVDALTLWHWFRRQSKLAYLVGSAGLFLLGLSLKHCHDGLMLFGMPSELAWMFALGIDYGLVCVEIAKIKAHAE